MNYIRHLGGFFIRLAEDQRMTPYHISLYFALFQQWICGTIWGLGLSFPEVK